MDKVDENGWKLMKVEKYQNYQPFKHPKDDINNYEKRYTKTAVYELKNDILVKSDDLDFSFSDRNFVSGECFR